MSINPLLTTYLKGPKFEIWFCLFSTFQTGLFFPQVFSLLRFYLGHNDPRKDFQIFVKGLSWFGRPELTGKNVVFTLHPPRLGSTTSQWQSYPKQTFFLNSRTTDHGSVKCSDSALLQVHPGKDSPVKFISPHCSTHPSNVKYSKKIKIKTKNPQNKTPKKKNPKKTNQTNKPPKDCFFKIQS